MFMLRTLLLAFLLVLSSQNLHAEEPFMIDPKTILYYAENANEAILLLELKESCKEPNEYVAIIMDKNYVGKFGCWKDNPEQTEYLITWTEYLITWNDGTKLALPVKIFKPGKQRYI